MSTVNDETSIKGHKDYEYESDWLKYTVEYLHEYSKKVTAEKNTIDKNIEYSLKHYSYDNTDEYYQYMLNSMFQANMLQRLKNLERSLKKPYFARVDFLENGLDRNDKLYIGKVSVIRDEDLYPIIIDWRAPIANLYYEERLGEAKFLSPDGEISGNISLKRQFIIEDAALQDFFDIDITASDDFLQIALGSSKDKRLKDIVSTIQAEQNRIIRADMHNAMIVQGAAGSGKTTIALHRIAYLLYNYEKSLSPANIMIIAPNKYFLSYISEVLPDLGVESVYQTTYDDFARDICEENLKIKPVYEKLSYLINHPEHTKTISRISEIKSAVNYHKIIDRYVDILADGFVPDKDFVIYKTTLMSFFEIRDLFCNYYKFLPVMKRINEVKKYMQNSLDKSKKQIIKDFEDDYDGRVRSIKRKMPQDCAERRQQITAVLDERDRVAKEINQSIKTSVTNHFAEKGKIKTLKSSEYYTKLLANPELFIKCSHGIITRNEAEAVVKLSAKTAAAGILESEDVGGCVYLHLKLFGTQSELRHIIIDEAQDIGLLQMYVLKQIMDTSSFTILGDLTQGIYSFKGIKDWNSVSKEIFGGKSVYMPLVQSYRTTVEIMGYANLAAEQLNLKDIPLAEPVIRHGSEVEIIPLDGYKKIAQEIDNRINDFKEMGYKSIAVVCKNMEECEKIIKNIGAKTKLTLIKGNETSYGGGTVIIPVHLCKGLEFDSVIISNASDEMYKKTELDIKLLYVAMTRALHELVIFTDKNKPLTEILA